MRMSTRILAVALASAEHATLPREVFEQPERLVDELTRIAGMYGYATDQRNTTRPALVHIARMLQQVLMPAGAGLEESLAAAGVPIPTVDPAEVEADIAVRHAASEPQRRAERLECGIVDAELAEEPQPDGLCGTCGELVGLVGEDPLRRLLHVDPAIGHPATFGGARLTAEGGESPAMENGGMA